MIAPLQRQHVRRRQRIALRARARTRRGRHPVARRFPAPARRTRLPVPRGVRRARRRLLPGLIALLRRPLAALLARRGRLRRRQAAIAAVPAAAAPAPVPRRPGDPRAVRVAILFAATLALAALLVLVGTGTLRFPAGAREVQFPVTDAADLELMQLMAPEEPEVPAGDLPGPKTLGTLSTSVYTVRPGDSVSGIAQRFGLAIDTVLSWNAIRDAHLVTPGRVLTLPNADGLRYVVRRGDTLEGIAKRNGIPIASLLDWNDLGTSVITVGQVLFLPGARMSAGDIAKALGTLFTWPLKGRISSRYGMRVGPVDGITRLHAGIDIKADIGTPVVAAMAGTVLEAGYNGTYGKYIILRHSGFQTLYGHLNAFSVAKGESVAQGRKIGEVGNTGVSTGPHLHFGVYVKGEPVDPQRYLK
jgi:murein DD-endopeptidase MepM/ murein hydrolase activator NlpD